MNDVNKFSERVKNVRDRLPDHYATMIVAKYKNVKKSDVFNVVHHGVKNEDILIKLEELAEFLTPINK